MGLREYLTEESFKIGDWISQKRSNATAYALIVGEQKKGFKTVYIDDDRPIAVIKTTSGWYPTPVKISEKDVPEKLLKKLMTKKQKMGL